MTNIIKCNQANFGIQFSHNKRGHALCCASTEREKKLNPVEFWHSDFVKQSRNDLNSGVMIKNCKECWFTESKNSISFRQTYNTQLNDLKQKDLPQSIDLDFSNLCNLKCIMCNSERSSSWAKELNINPKTKGIVEISNNDFDSICSLSKDLKFLTIQGGEPSLIKQYEDYFNFLNKNNIIKNVTVNVVTNLTNINNNFFELLNNFKCVNINVSIDSYGDANNYIRFPSHFDKINTNLIELSNKKFNIGVHTALNTMGMFRIYEFLVWLNATQNLFEKNNNTLKVYLQQVWNPDFLNINYSPEKLKIKFLQDIKNFFNRNNSIRYGLKFNLELKNIKNTLLKTKIDKSEQLKNYISTLDNRRSIKIKDYIAEYNNYF